MKRRMKVLSLVMAAVMLVTATIFGTMAYLTAKDTVTNTFTVGSVAIKLDEAQVNPDGTLVGKQSDRTTENSYKLMPGHKYIKDPTVTVLKGSESSYVRILVTLSNEIALKEVFGGDFLPENYVQGWDRTAWIPSGISRDTVANTITYEFRYKETVSALEHDVVLDALFDNFTVPGIIRNNAIAKLDSMDITVDAYAIQADGFANADAAWGHFPRS